VSPENSCAMFTLASN